MWNVLHNLTVRQASNISSVKKGARDSCYQDMTKFLILYIHTYNLSFNDSYLFIHFLLNVFVGYLTN